MTTSVLSTYEIDIKDIEYLRHGNQPRGTGPFPLVVDLHGGAWCRGDRPRRSSRRAAGWIFGCLKARGKGS